MRYIKNYFPDLKSAKKQSSTAKILEKYFLTPKAEIFGKPITV